jgi:hypothetical protein
METTVRSAKEEFRLYHHQWSQMIEDLRPMTDNASTRKLFSVFNNENIMLEMNSTFDGTAYLYTRLGNRRSRAIDTLVKHTAKKGSKANFMEQRLQR